MDRQIDKPIPTPSEGGHLAIGMLRLSDESSDGCLMMSMVLSLDTKDLREANVRAKPILIKLDGIRAQAEATDR